MVDQETFYRSSRPGLRRGLLDMCYRTGSSPLLLAQSESRMLQPLKSPFTLRDIKIGPETFIHTLHVRSSRGNQAIPLVMLPGMGAGIGLFVKNLDTFSEVADVYAIDPLGFGRSSKPIFSNNPREVVGQYVQSLEDWRVGVGLEKFILFGHSFGGYLATWYACQYPNRVVKLILSEPWGFPSISDRKPSRRHRNPSFMDIIFRILVYLLIINLKIFQPFTFMRWSFGTAKYFIRMFRGDFFDLFKSIVRPIVCCDYVFHYNCQYPSGEAAFSRLHIPLTWCNNPLLPDAIKRIDASIPIHFIYGRSSWMYSISGYSVKYLLENEVEVSEIEGGTHHIYAENSGVFNRLVCESMEKLTN